MWLASRLTGYVLSTGRKDEREGRKGEALYRRRRVSLDEYEEGQGEYGLTGGALSAQLKRFYELWSAHIFIERTCWDRLSESARSNLRSVIQCFFYQMNPEADLKVARSQVDSSIEVVSKETTLAAFRTSFGNPPNVENFKNFKFPSGLPFVIDT